MAQQTRKPILWKIGGFGTVKMKSERESTLNIGRLDCTFAGLESDAF